MARGYKPKATFTVENEKDIARPPEVRFDKAPAGASGGTAGTAK
jgi:LemA protein